MNLRNLPVAVFDSGVGGISVLRELTHRMPREKFLYFGDCANAPYGTKTTERVRELTCRAVEDLLTQGVKAVVVACNTATSAAIEDLRRAHPDTILVGIEPALKLAAERHPRGKILVMATDVTLREEKFRELMARFSGSHSVEGIHCPGLVERIEGGQLEGPEMEDYLRSLLVPHLTGDTAAVVLGCTHYPFAVPALRRVLGESIDLIDGGEGTARETERRLAAAGLLRESGDGEVMFRSSDNRAQTLSLMEHLLES